MNTENSNPGQNPDNNKWEKEPEAKNTSGNDTNNRGLETNGPNKNQSFNVLNKDGSLPDMPEENVEGKGALDGTVGLGT